MTPLPHEQRTLQRGSTMQPRTDEQPVRMRTISVTVAYTSPDHFIESFICTIAASTSARAEDCTSPSDRHALRPRPRCARPARMRRPGAACGPRIGLGLQLPRARLQFALAAPFSRDGRHWRGKPEHQSRCQASLCRGWRRRHKMGTGLPFKALGHGDGLAPGYVC